MKPIRFGTRRARAWARATPVDSIVILPAAGVILGFALGAVHGAGAPMPDLVVDRLASALRLGSAWSTTFGVAGACAGILLSAGLVFFGRTIERCQLFAGTASISLFLLLLEVGILVYANIVSECFAFPQILGVFGILLFGYALALGSYLLAVTALRRRERPARPAKQREWFLPDAPSLN